MFAVWAKMKSLSRVNMAVLYLLISLLWGVYSESVLFQVLDDPEERMRLDRVNDAIYVLASGWCLYLLSRKYREKAQMLKESQERYDSLFEYHPDAIYSLDREGNFLTVNPAGLRVGGYSLEQLQDKEFHSSMTVPPHDKEAARKRFLRVLSGEAVEETVNAVSGTGEHLVFDLTHFPMYANGEIVGVYGMARNITEKVRAEEELRRAKQQLESFIQNSADGIAMVDVDGYVRMVNQAFEEMFGWKEPELIGTRLPNIPPDRLERVLELLRSVKDGTAITGYEAQRLRKDGSMIEVSVTVSPIRDAAGNVVALSAVYRDMTEKRRTEELLRKSEKLSIAGQLAAGVAHEIRNPLTAIKGLAELMHKSGEYRRDYFEILLSELERIDMITGEFLLLAKPQAARYEKRDVRLLLQSVIALLEMQANMLKVRIHKKFDERLPVTCCEENQLKQVFLNVIKNAIESMPDGGEVTIEALLRDEDHICVRIKDQGCGIPPERLQQLGEPFYTTKEKGTGLGLMISYKIVKEHRGWMQYHSEPGQGTTAEIFLPVCEDRVF